MELVQLQNWAVNSVRAINYGGRVCCEIIEHSLWKYNHEMFDGSKRERIKYTRKYPWNFYRVLLILKFKDPDRSCWGEPTSNNSLVGLTFAKSIPRFLSVDVKPPDNARIARKKSVCKQCTTLSVQRFPDIFIDFAIEEQIQPIFRISAVLKGYYFIRDSFYIATNMKL